MFIASEGPDATVVVNEVGVSMEVEKGAEIKGAEITSKIWTARKF